MLWHHLVENYLPVGPAIWLGWLRAGTSLSWSGVDLFFVLSGYFIGGILLDNRESPRLAGTFYARRAARILPLYYVFLAVGLFLSAQGLGGTPALPAWTYALFLTNAAITVSQEWGSAMLSPLWSIAVEEQFYLTAPWIVRWVRPAMIPRLLVGLVAGAWLLRVAIHLLTPHNHNAIHTLVFTRMDTFALGALVAWSMRRGLPPPLVGALRRSWPLWSLVALAILFVATCCNYFGANSAMNWAGYSLLGLAYAFALFVVVALRPAPVVSILTFRPLEALGRYSYFVYLWHMVFGLALVSRFGGDSFVLDNPRSLGVVLAALLLTCGAAVLSWRFFEHPLIRLGRRFRY